MTSSTIAWLRQSLLALLCLSALCAGAAASAAPLEGTWRLDEPKPFGVTLHSYLKFEPTAAGPKGSVVANGSVELPFVDAKQVGAETVFRVSWGWTFRVRRDGANLSVVANYGGGEEPPATAVPVPESDSQPEPRLPLPPVHDVADNGLARTPPMGWNSWNHFAEKVTEADVRAVADALVASGMQDAGYVYVNIDDTRASATIKESFTLMRSFRT